MSRTVRRKSGKRNWMKMEPEFEYVEGYQLRIGCLNWSEYYEWKSKWWLLSGKHKVELVYGLKWYKTHYPVAVTRKRIDLEYKAKAERDGRWNYSTSSFKEAVRKSNRAKQAAELYKVQHSYTGDLEDMYDYDPSYENTSERSLIWVHF